MTARYRLAEEAEREFGQVGKAGAEGRQFLDVVTLRQVLTMRDEKGIGAAQIERQLGLKTGVVCYLDFPVYLWVVLLGIFVLCSASLRRSPLRL